MNQPIFAFVFTFGEERGEFRCKRNFVDGPRKPHELNLVQTADTIRFRARSAAE